MAKTPISEPNEVDGMAAIRETLDQMLRVMNAQLHLQRVGLLEDGHILRFNAPNMQRIAMSLPDAADDYVQGVIVQTRGFYEAKILARVQDEGIVGPASVVCDVGANIGNHTVYFGAVLGVAKVIAFEPQTHCHATLLANIALNGLEKRVVTHHSLVGAEAGHGQMVQFNTRNLGGTSFEVDDTGSMPIKTLDKVLTKADVAKLDLIKIDVEGMQMAVLQGAVGILKTRKPALWVELLQRDDAFEETAAFLAGFGYVAERLARNDFLFRAVG